MPHCCAGSISADADTDVRLELADDLLHLPQRFDEIDQDRDVLPVLSTVEASYGQTYDLITGLRHTLHLHTTKRTHKQNLRFRIQFLQRVSDTHCGNICPPVPPPEIKYFILFINYELRIMNYESVLGTSVQRFMLVRILKFDNSQFLFTP